MCLRPKSLIQIILSHNSEVLRTLPMTFFMLRLYYVKNHSRLVMLSIRLAIGDKFDTVLVHNEAKDRKSVV